MYIPSRNFKSQSEQKEHRLNENFYHIFFSTICLIQKDFNVIVFQQKNYRKNMKVSSIILVSIILILNIIASVKASKHFLGEKKRIRINLILIWFIPIVWSSIILIITSRPRNRKEDGYIYREAGYSNYTKFGG